jgi:hypothetical protein
MDEEHITKPEEVVAQHAADSSTEASPWGEGSQPASTSGYNLRKYLWPAVGVYVLLSVASTLVPLFGLVWFYSLYKVSTDSKALVSGPDAAKEKSLALWLSVGSLIGFLIAYFGVKKDSTELSKAIGGFFWRLVLVQIVIGVIMGIIFFRLFADGLVNY